MARRKVKAQARRDAIQARYDAAGTGRRMASWNPPHSGPNTAIQGVEKIRSRSRDAHRNDWSAVSATQKWVTNLIGMGIVPRFSRFSAKARKQAVRDLWSDFVKAADADGVLDFYGMQTLAVRSWLESGEVFARRRFRSDGAPLPVPVQVQLLEADFVPMLDADTWPGLPDGNKIRSGIELNRFGRRVAYWVYKAHPGDKDGTPSADQLVRVLASEMIHVFEPTRPGQLRGVSMLAPTLARLRLINDYDDAVLVRQQIANLFTLFITRGGKGNPNVDPLSGQPYAPGSGSGAGKPPVVTLGPGISHELADGEDVKFANPPEAGTTYSDYMRTQHMGTAAGASLPYELFSGDIKEVSDRTLRVVINEFRRHAGQRQWQIVIPMLCRPVMSWFAEAAALAGKITADEIDPVTRAEWQPEGWQYIHPVQDVQGKQMEVDAGFRSRSSVIAERGDDPEDVDQERADDQKREDKLDLTPKPPAGDPANDPNAAPAKPGQKKEPA